MTRPGAHRIRRLARCVDLAHIVLETDAPAIGLEGVRPPHVRPWHVAEVARALSELRGVALEDIVEATDANAALLFGGEVLRRPLWVQGDSASKLANVS